MEDLKRQPNESRSDWGWRLLRHDLSHPEQPAPPQQPEQVNTSKDGSIVNNIYNYSQGVPQTMGRFRFASVYATLITVVILTIAVILLAKVGFFDYLWMWLF